MWRVDWDSFLSGTTPTMTIFAPSMPLTTAPGAYSSLSVLVGATVNVFHGLRSFQAAPTPSEGFARIDEMKHVAKTLARLGRGGDLSGEVSNSERIQVSPRTPALHTFLHDLLQMADAPDEALRSDEAAWTRELSAYRRRDRRLMLFFSSLDEVIERLTVPSKVVEELERVDPRCRRPGAPRDSAMDWLLTRLMWIWRDALRRRVTIYMPRDGVAPPPESLMSFIVAILSKFEPVQPYEFLALEKKLNALRPNIPGRSLFTT